MNSNLSKFLGVSLLLATVATLPLTAPLAAMTADDVIAKHVEAKGGKAAWDAIHSMKMTGNFTAFSIVNPFTMHRKKDDLYHVDRMLGTKLEIVGYDGETAWWESHFFQEGATEIQGEADLAVLKRDVEFTTPMIGYPGNGVKISLSDETDLDGEPAIALSIDRGDGSEETWYLNPDSHLEFARVSPGSDFGRPMPQTTYFEDFREVSGVMIPHFTETQWYTRDRVVEVHDVEVNLEIDDALFRLPAPLGMETLRHLAGKWKVNVESRQDPRSEDFNQSERMTEIESLLGGAFLFERFKDENGIEAIRTITYDRFRKRHVITQANATTTYLDIQYADGFGEDGSMTSSNEESGTTLDMFGMNILLKTGISDVTPDGFRATQSISMDGGENWVEMERERPPEESADQD